MAAGRDIRGITIQIGGDTTGLNTALKNVNQSISSTQSQLKDVGRLLKLDPSNTELLTQRQQLLSKAVDGTREKLEALKAAEQQAQQQFAEGRISQEQYAALRREIIATEQQLENLEQQAGEANVTLQQISVAGDRMQEFGGKVTNVGKKMLGVTAAIAGVGAAGISAWDDLDGAYDTIAKGTGATGEKLKDLQKSFDNVFSAIPAEAGATGNAIADINTRFGFTGDVLENCTKSFLKFAEVNNTDVSTAIANVSRYMGDAGIDSADYEKVLDQLTAASQSSGLGVDKLSESLTKYGAPMRAMGLTTQESIAIFAGWEKAGVNTEIAFSGMKKAIGTWGKEGKDASQEFKKTLDEIAACPDIASATSKAIEIFGQKAGPDLADAIKGGRFAYEDYLEVLEGSAGQLGQTFDDTLDPIDDVKVAMQDLKIEGAKFGGTLLEVLAPAITKLIQSLKRVVGWFSNLSDSQKRAVIIIGMVVAALGPLLIIIGQIATGIGALMGAATAIMSVLTFLAASSGPVILLTVAFAALFQTLDIVTASTGKYYDEAKTLSEEEQQHVDQVDKLKEAYDQMDQQRSDSMANIQAETGYQHKIFEELKNITDENGKVKEGYENRAKVITGQLSDALGIEIELTDDQIKNYQELCDNLDRIIQKKQAEAILDANQGAYTEAIQKKNDALSAYLEAQNDVKKATDDLNQAEEEHKKICEEQSKVLEEAKEKGIEPDAAALRDLSKAWEESSGKVTGYKEKLGELTTNLQNAEGVYTGYSTTIANQEALMEASVSGNQQKIDDAILRTTNNFQTAETSTKECLERQHQDFVKKYDEMKSAVEQGATWISQTQIDQMKKLVDDSQAELDKLPGVYNKAGKDAVLGYANGIDVTLGYAASAAKRMGQASLDGAREALDSHSPSRKMYKIGGDFNQGFANGITEHIGTIVTAVTRGFGEAVSFVSSLPQKAAAWGSDFISGFVGALQSKIGDVKKATKGVADTISSYLHFTRPDKGPLRNYEEWMPHMIEGMSKGLDNNMWRITDQLQNMTSRISLTMDVNSQSQGNSADLTKIEGLLDYYLPTLKGANVVLDDGTLVGKMTPQINAKFSEGKETQGRNG